jgi:hypothetical protein
MFGVAVVILITYFDRYIILAGEHEVLASGPIEDLISHREHRCAPLCNFYGTLHFNSVLSLLLFPLIICIILDTGYLDHSC